MKTMLILFLISTAIIAQDSTDTDIEFNYMENSWEFTYPEEELQYNYMEGTWEFTDPEAELEYNYMEGTWEFPEEKQPPKRKDP